MVAAKHGIRATCPECGLEATYQGIRRHRTARHGVVHTTKMCTRCLEEKPIGQFGLQPSGALRPHCSPCRVEVTTARRKHDRETLDADSKARRDLRKHARNYFGISLEEYLDHVDRLREKQRNRCAICGDPDPDKLDHCHQTNRIRGLLCLRCNLALGYLRDTPEFATAAARYLRKRR